MNANEMYIINPDYLEFRCHDESGYISSFVTNGSNKLYIISQKVKLSKTTDFKYYSTRYLKCFEIILDDEKVGYLYTDPIRNTYYSTNEIISIRIDNNTLYNPDLNKILEDVVTELQLTLKGITRLDIAYDTDTDVLKRFKTLYNNTNKYTYKNRGKTTVNGTGNFDTQINIGSLRSQGKTVIIYDKSTLLRQQNKDHLLALYETVFSHKEIYRVEVRITSKTTNKFDINILELGNKEYLESLFESMGGSFIDFRYKESNNNTTRQTKLNFIPLNCKGVELSKKISVKSIKPDNSMKYLIWKLHCDREKDNFSPISREIKMVESLYVKMSGLEDWLKKKVIRNLNK
jgi:hypothetical protein